MGLVVAAEDDQHRGEEVAGEDGHGDAAGHAFGMGRRRAPEIGAVELLEDDRPALLPGLAGQALAAAEAQGAADRREAGRLAVEPAAELEHGAVGARHPDLAGADESLHAAGLGAAGLGMAAAAAIMTDDKVP